MEKVFRNALLSAAKHSIRAGYVQDCVPGLSREITDKIEKRDEIRSVDPHNPEITQLNNDIAADIGDRLSIQLTGVQTQRSCGMWARSLNGKRKFLPPNQPISFGSTTFSDIKAIANKFIWEYTPPLRSNK